MISNNLAPDYVQDDQNDLSTTGLSAGLDNSYATIDPDDDDDLEDDDLDTDTDLDDDLDGPGLDDDDLGDDDLTDTDLNEEDEDEDDLTASAGDQSPGETGSTETPEQQQSDNEGSGYTGQPELKQQPVGNDATFKERNEANMPKVEDFPEIKPETRDLGTVSGVD